MTVSTALLFPMAGVPESGHRPTRDHAHGPPRPLPVSTADTWSVVPSCRRRAFSGAATVGSFASYRGWSWGGTVVLPVLGHWGTIFRPAGYLAGALPAAVGALPASAGALPASAGVLPASAGALPASA